MGGSMNRTANRTTIRASAPESYAAVGFHMPLRRMLRRASATCGLLCAALAGAALAACAQAPQPQLREVFDRTVPLASGGSFALENVNGAVTVTGWDREAVEIRAVKTTSHAATDLLQVQIEVAAVPGRVAVDTVNPPDGGAEVNVAYSVRVPRRVLLQHVSTVNGTVRVTGVESAGTLRSVNGDIEVLDSAGGFSAHTTNGNIQMELARLTAIAPLSAERRQRHPGRALLERSLPFYPSGHFPGRLQPA